MNSLMPQHSAQRGVALVIVLWMLALLTIMAAAYGRSMRTETRVTAHMIQSSQARALAEVGIWLGVNEMLRAETAREWHADDSANRVEYGNGAIEIRIADESGKIDLNNAQPELLEQLFKSVDLAPDLTPSLVDAILDWRDRDNLKRPSGAEDDDYRLAGLDYGAKDGPFNTIEELRQVLGMTSEIYARLAPALTVHTHQTGINPQYAPPVALRALPGMDAEVINQYLLARDTEILPGTTTPLPTSDRRLTTNRKGQVLSITSTGFYGDSRTTLVAVIQPKRGAGTPFSVLSWREQ